MFRTRKAAPAVTHPAGITLDPAMLAAILDRWSAYAGEVGGDDCPDCERLRATPFHCDVCGYTGVPLVHPCTCTKEREKDIEFYGKKVARAEALKERMETRPWEFDDDEDLEEEVRDELPHLEWCREALIERLTAPDVRCPVAKPHCCHGEVECPVCIDGEENIPRRLVDPWVVIRDLRTALATQGGR